MVHQNEASTFIYMWINWNEIQTIIRVFIFDLCSTKCRRKNESQFTTKTVKYIFIKSEWENGSTELGSFGVSKVLVVVYNIMLYCQVSLLISDA